MGRGAPCALWFRAICTRGYAIAQHPVQDSIKGFVSCDAVLREVATAGPKGDE